MLLRASQAGVHFVGRRKNDGPLPVTFGGDYDSEFGLLNVMGNVEEWVRPGWTMGGNFVISRRNIPVEPSDNNVAWTLDLLKDPRPSVEAFRADNFPDNRDQSHYPDRLRISADNLDRVGLRCVIPLGTPKDMP